MQSFTDKFSNLRARNSKTHRLILISLLFAVALINGVHAAPARAIYFSDNEGIKKINPDGTGEITILSGSNGMLQLDSPNGHIYYSDKPHRATKIYRANLDGTGITQIYSGTEFYDYAIDIANQKIYTARNRSGVFVYDIDASTTVPIYEAPSGNSFVVPQLDYDQENSTVYWHHNFIYFGHISTPGEVAGTATVYPALSDFQFGTKVHFDSGAPVAYAIGINNSWSKSTLLTRGLSGTVVTTVELPFLFSDLEFYGIDVDTEDGKIYYVGAEPASPDPSSPMQKIGIFRSALDGSGFTHLVEGGVFSIAIDTADLEDTEDPLVSIITPIGGVTNNQVIGLFGTASDDTTVASVSWSLNGINQGPLGLTDSFFSVPAVTLNPGENVIEVVAADLIGNTGSSQVTITWSPLRQVTVNSDISVREGRRVWINTMLESSGEVAGMTYKLLYDAERFEAPQVRFSEQLAGFSPSANSLTPGEISITFASATDTIQTGEQVLVSVSLRARSLAATTNTNLSIQIEDMADSGGNPITVGTYSGEANIEIIGRTFTGDINSNDRLDIGDASRMQSMLTGASEKRAWDDTLNDLNSNSNLDSGDVIRVLRAVVGIDGQPALLQKSRALRVAAGVNPNAPRAVLVLSASHASPGETVTLNVMLENVDSAFSGASFTLDYPSDLIRLNSPSAHTPGSLVAGDAFLLWNLSPSQNNYTTQDGSISFGASSATNWPGSAAGGSIARFEFTVTSEVTAADLWPITIRNFEISTDSGFEITPVNGTTVNWVANPKTFQSWQALHFTPAELANPNISSAGIDADGDTFSNALEYFSGTNPRDPNSRPIIQERIVPSADENNHCLEISFQRAPWAIDANVTLQVSNNLSGWQDVANPSANSSTNYTTGLETVTAQLDPPASGTSQYVRLKVEFNE